MKAFPRLAMAALLLGPGAAMASDPHGLLTLIVGLPLLLVASVVMGLLLIPRPGRTLRIVSVVLFLPTLLYSLYVAVDAAKLFNDVGSENSMIGFAFFGLLALVCLLFYLGVRRPLRENRVDGAVGR